MALNTRFGADFRRVPPVQPALPGLLWKPVVGLSLLLGVLLWLCPSLPDGERALLLRVSYLLHLGILVPVWVAALGGIFLMLFLLHGQIHDAFLRSFDESCVRPVRGEVLTHGAAFLALALCGLLLPAWWSLALVGLWSSVVLGLLLVPEHPRLALLWRPSGAERAIRSIEIKPFLALQYAGFLLAVLCLVLYTRGGQLGGPVQDTRMPITAFLGTALGWTSAAGTCVMMLRLVRLVRLERTHDPARPIRSTVHLDGCLPAERKAALRRGFAAMHWKVRFAPEPRRSTDVPVVLAEAPVRPGDPFGPAWPLELRAEELFDEHNLWRYRRRWEIQCRRLLVRGLRRLFKRAARQPRRNGEGYWIGLQHWFVTGLSRDREEDEPDLREQGLIDPIIGPPYHVLFHREVRHHFHQVMSKLEVDLLFVEDGVSFRRLRPVLETLFEVYDTHGGRQRAEERHFVGLEGVCVMIHDFALDQPFRSSTYPEPGYDDIGRARILHVFRDRGGERTQAPAPSDLEWLPLVRGR